MAGGFESNKQEKLEHRSHKSHQASRYEWAFVEVKSIQGTKGQVQCTHLIHIKDKGLKGTIEWVQCTQCIYLNKQRIRTLILIIVYWAAYKRTVKDKRWANSSR